MAFSFSLFLVLAFFGKFEVAYGQLDLLGDLAPGSLTVVATIKNLKFYLVKGSNNYTQFYEIDPTDDGTSLNAANFSPTVKCFISVHGYQGGKNDVFNTNLIRGLQQAGAGANLLIVDYSSLNNVSYPVQLYVLIPQVGKLISAYLVPYLAKNGLPPSIQHYVCFSFGGAICHFAGMDQKGQLGNIDCIDHVGFLNALYYLNSSDAQLVRSILCSNVLGTTKATGLFNYVYNKLHQPQCDAYKGNLTLYETCNHLQCTVYGAAAIANVTRFPANLCPSISDAENNINNCQNTPSTYVFQTDKSYGGNFPVAYEVQTVACPLGCLNTPRNQG